MSAPITAAVVTVVAGRHEHLRVQRRFLARSTVPALHVVVAVDDPAVASVVAEQPDLHTLVLTVPTHPAGLPVAAARNAGAAAAWAAGAGHVAFLDVDCIPAPDLLGRFAAAVGTEPDALLCGPVTYLPPAPATGWTTPALAAARNPHAARPDPAAGVVVDLPPALFWSLSFVVTAATWQRIGGFYEGYVGYGAEDTDFAVTAQRAGVRVGLVGGADAFHQHHAVNSPPVEHLDDIVRNSNVYLGRNGEVPMRGWLDAFDRSGLVREIGTRPRRVDAIRVATVPARHPFLDAVLPPTIERVDTGRTSGWEPDPLFTPAGLARAAERTDVVHVHFGYDHLEQTDLAAWLDLLQQQRIPLVLTVHDLRNPHHETPHRHDGHLRALTAAAARVLTLTDAAAREIEQRFDGSVEVVAHPTLLDGPVASQPPADPPHILIPLKALRRNVVDAVAVVAAAAAGAKHHGARVRVLIEPSALERPALHALGGLDVDLDITPRLPHDELCARVARAHACVLPYRFGTHSGWLELCRDLGTHVIAPDCGHYASQWNAVTTYGNNERTGLDAASLAEAVQLVLARPTPAPADPARRAAERDLARAAHDALYREVVAR